MSILKGIKYNFMFLTRFPISKEAIKSEDIAPKIWLCPIVGFVLGLLSAFLSLILFKFLPFLLVGFITLGVLLLMTGAHHTDGLIDFGDGLMAIGSPERKIEAMHDVAIGTGGFILGLIVLVLTGITISYSMNFILVSLIISEIGAKFGMIAACSFGKSAGTKTADPFIQLNKKKHAFMALFLSILLIYFTILIVLFFNLIYIDISYIRIIFSYQTIILTLDLIQIMNIYLAFVLGTFIPLIIVLRLANRNFNGLTGDCLGALNELTRLSILILFLMFYSLKLI